MALTLLLSSLYFHLSAKIKGVKNKYIIQFKFSYLVFVTCYFINKCIDFFITILSLF